MILGKRSRYAIIYRPQHFVGHEVPIGLARMLIYGDDTGAPRYRRAEVIAAAKKSLKASETLDGEGGYAVYGLLEDSANATGENLVPLGLTQGAVTTREIPEDGLITYDNVRIPGSAALDVRRLQDRLYPLTSE